ncbi:unnamed protein product, partial [Ectocarpus fasciculatus]
KVASIIEHGGDDPQIPRDVIDGCGTLPAGAQDETATDTSNRVDSKSHPGEARGGSVEVVEGAAAVLMEAAVGAGEGGSAAPAAAGRVKTADRSSLRSPSAISITADGVPVLARADEDENAVAAAAAGGGGCPRCGARVPCACGGARGGGGGGAGGGGNATPGRRFGSPQQSKGLRNVMSWATGGSITPPAGRGSEGDDGDSQDGSRSSNDGNRNGIERRRRRLADDEKGTTGWNSESSGGSVRSFSSAESFNKSSSSHGSRWRDRRKTGDGGKYSSSSPRDSGGASVVSSGGVRKRSSSRGTGFRKSQEGDDGVGGGSDHETDSVDRSDNCLAAPARPKSPRSPRAHSSTRLKRVSGSSSAEASGCPDGGESEGEGMAAAVGAATTKDGDSMRRRGSSNTGVTDNGYEDQGEGTARLARSQPRGVDERTPASATLAGTTESKAALHEASPTEEAGIAPTRRRQGDGAETEFSSKGTSPGSPHLVAVESGASEKETRQSGSSTSPAIRRSSTTAAAAVAASASGPDGTAAAAVGGGVVLDRLALTPRTPRSPRIVGSDSEPFKSAKRLSEALTFAASSSEEDFLTGTATAAAAGSTGPTPRRESGALEGALAIVEEARGVHEGMTIGGRVAEGRGNSAAVLGAPS